MVLTWSTRSSHLLCTWEMVRPERGRARNSARILDKLDIWRRLTNQPRVRGYCVSVATTTW